jgi:transcriptional regulator with XRE-family HTH domain
MYKEEFSELIKQRRKILNIDQRKLAKLAGIHYNTLLQLESGSGNPTLEVLHKVAEVLGLELKLVVKKSDMQ